MRTFIAIPLPENMLVFLTGIQNEIRKNGLKASWTGKSSMHLTLRFLGDTEEKDLRLIIKAMEATALACKSFTLSAQGVGVFPSVKKPRVIWSGVKGQIHQLETLKRTLESNIARVGFKGDNSRFSPHFTLGRFKKKVDSGLVIKMICDFQLFASDNCRVSSMVLYKSDLKPSGAVHTPLFEGVLSGISSR